MEFYERASNYNMLSKRKTANIPRSLRELSEKELNEITRAVGDRARAQTVDQKERMKTSLRRELESTRAKYVSKGKKGA